MDTEKVEIKLGEETLQLQINFKAAYLFSTKIKDPTLILNEFLKGDESFLTIPNLVNALKVALEGSGINRSFDEIGEAMYKHRQKIDLTSSIAEYITLLATSGKGFGKKKAEDESGKHQPSKSLSEKPTAHQ